MCMRYFSGNDKGNSEAVKDFISKEISTSVLYLSTGFNREDGSRGLRKGGIDRASAKA